MNMIKNNRSTLIQNCSRPSLYCIAHNPLSFLAFCHARDGTTLFFEGTSHQRKYTNTFNKMTCIVATYEARQEREKEIQRIKDKAAIMLAYVQPSRFPLPRHFCNFSSIMFAFIQDNDNLFFAKQRGVFLSNLITDFCSSMKLTIYSSNMI